MTWASLMGATTLVAAQQVCLWLAGGQVQLTRLPGDIGRHTSCRAKPSRRATQVTKSQPQTSHRPLVWQLGSQAQGLGRARASAGNRGEGEASGQCEGGGAAAAPPRGGCWQGPGGSADCELAPGPPGHLLPAVPARAQALLLQPDHAQRLHRALQAALHLGPGAASPAGPCCGCYQKWLENILFTSKLSC